MEKYLLIFGICMYNYRYIYNDRTPFEKLSDSYFCPGKLLKLNSDLISFFHGVLAFHLIELFTHLLLVIFHLIVKLNTFKTMGILKLLFALVRLLVF